MPDIVVSVVICTYNRERLLKMALASLAESDIVDPETVEVIVVDNNSNDGTQQVVEELAGGDFPFSLRYVFEPTQGISRARNRGVDEANGAYVAFVDDDQLVHKDYVATLDKAFAQTQAICIGGPIEYYNANNLPEWLPPLLEYTGQFYAGDEIKVMSADDNKLRMGNMAFNRQALVEFGKFNVELGRKGKSLMGGEEDELQERLHAAGHKLAYHPGIIQYHYLRPERLKKRYWRKHLFAQGRTVTIYKTPPSLAGKNFLGAPVWLWRSLVTQDIPHYALSWLPGKMKQRFQKELRIHRRLGQIYQARKIRQAHLRPEQTR